MGIFKELTGVLVLVCLSGAAYAQDTSSNVVATKTDWSVFTDENPKECWSVAVPDESVFMREGRIVADRARDQPLLMVFYRPSAGASGQVAFTGGYPFKDGSTVTVEISGSEFAMFTEGEWAWPPTTSDDAKIVTAMKRGGHCHCHWPFQPRDHHQGHLLASWLHRRHRRRRDALRELTERTWSGLKSSTSCASWGG